MRVTYRALPFSYLGLLGGTAVSAMFGLFTYFAFRSTIVAALADLGSGMRPDEMKSFLSDLRWSFFTTGILIGAIMCAITHQVASFLGRSDFLLFALIGFVCVMAIALVKSDPPNATVSWFVYIFGHLLNVTHGPATTSTYWLIAKWRAA